MPPQSTQKAIIEAIAEEREACAKIADEYAKIVDELGAELAAQAIAQRIRERGTL